MQISLRPLRSGEVNDRGTLDGGEHRIAACVLQDNALWQAPCGVIALILVLDGTAEVRCSDGRWTLASRRWMLLGREVTPVVQTRGRSRVLCVAIDPQALAVLDPGTRSATPLRGRFGLAAWRALRALRQGIAASGEPVTLPSASAEQLLAALLDGAELDVDIEQRTPGRTQARRRKLLARMLRARLYIEGHADRVVRITELARLCSFSPWHFTRTFHQMFGETPQACGVRVRLQRALGLVCHSRLAISEIAAACGFENASSFARAFHERFGESASRVRARHLLPVAALRRLGG